MGVRNLWDILESCKKTLPLHHLQNKRVCIDLSCWMVQLHSVNKSYCANKEKVYLRGLFHRVRALIALNCSVIFVTDGSIPAIKLATYRRRLNSGREATQDEPTSKRTTSLPRNAGSEFSCMIKEAKLLGIALGIPTLDGIEEAEAQCALLNLESCCDGCFTLDSDIFLFGGRTVYRDICLADGGHVVCYEMDDIERKLGYGRNSLIALALLLGSDYSHRVHGLGRESACQIVKSVGDEVVLQRIASEGLSFLKKSKNSKKRGQLLKCNMKPDLLHCGVIMNGRDDSSAGVNQLSQVIDAYLKPKCHSADSNAVQRVLVEIPFHRAMLQEICGRFFEWPPEKTDEYVLPKIAERDLRRFANLRATSFELGAKLSLDQMPVKCPLSEIIKRRKVQGNECFEVSWLEIDGLEASIVPADLIESACPEKILEFEEMKLKEKKQKQCKPRKKKSEDEPSIPDITLKLQDLVLDIESQSFSSCKASISSSSVNVVREDNITSKEPLLVARTTSDFNDYHSGPTSTAREVIDLLSPSPICSRNVSRCEEWNGKNVSVIDLSDSENEVSTEHSRKARELRLFLAGIRNEILLN